MALSIKVGTIAEPATTGTQAYTGVGFEPKALIVWSDGKRATDGTSAGARLTFGAATPGVSVENAVGIESIDALGTSNTNRYHDTAAVIRVLADAVAGDSAVAKLSAVGSDGFTLNWTNVHDSGTARLYHYLAIGGDDLTNALASTFTASSSTGNQSVTAVGFTPDMVLLFGCAQTTAGGAIHAIFCLGAFTATEQWSTSFDDEDNQGITDAERTQRTDRCYMQRFNGSAFQQAAFVSMDTDGFTINWSTASARIIGYLALKGGQYKLGAVSQKTSTGTQGYTGVGFEPTGLMLASFCNVSTATAQAHARMAIGAASSSTSRGAAWFGSVDAQGDSIADSAIDSDAIITMQTEGTPTEDARADLESFDSDGFTLDWEAADATAREILYWAMASEAEGGGGTILPQMMQHYYGGQA